MPPPKRKPRAKRPRRPPRIPRNGARRVRSPRTPDAVEVFYVIALRRVAKAFARAVSKALYPRISEFAKPAAEDEETERKDARDDDVAELMHELRETAAKSFDAEEFISATTKAATRTKEHSRREGLRLGIKLKKEPTFKTLIDGWRKDCVARIESVQEDQLDKIERILDEGFGMRAETLAKEIARQVEDVTESRAEMIARDQVLTLNAKITRGRHAEAGIERFAWTTSGDERVRESHAAIDGQVFSYDDLPEVDGEKVFPGEPPMCRCIPFPILPELDDDENATAA